MDAKNQAAGVERDAKNQAAGAGGESERVLRAERDTQAGQIATSLPQRTQRASQINNGEGLGVTTQ